MNTHMPPSHLHSYTNDGLYRTTDDPCTLAGTYAAGPSHIYSSYTGAETDQISPDGHINHHRVPKYGSYPYAMQNSARDTQWPQTITQSSSSGGDSGAPTSNNSTHSPTFVESPILTSSEMSYVNRYPVEDQKTSMNTLETAPYVFPTSRSISPTSTPPSSSSTSLTSPFQFAFPDGSVGQERPEYIDYRRHSAEVTLHGGTADISLAGPGSDAVRYRFGTRRANSGPERPLLPAVPQFSGSENGSQHERGGSSEGESPYMQTRLRPRRGAAASPTSRSPSPGAPPISGTLAVIKAQAFGALRRTRARTKKTSEGASRVAMEVLEARGIGMGVNVSAGSKRPRLQHDDGSDMQP